MIKHLKQKMKTQLLQNYSIFHFMHIITPRPIRKWPRLAMQLDSGPVKRRATHALRSAVPWDAVIQWLGSREASRKPYGKPYGNPWKTKFLVHGSPHFTTRNLVFQCFANVSGKISTSYSVTLLLLGRYVNAVDLQRRMLLFRMPDVCLNCLCHFAWPGSFGHW